MGRLIIALAAFAFVGLCFYYYKGGVLFQGRVPSDPPAVHSTHSSSTVRDIQGRLWKCTGTGSNRSCKPQDGLSSL